MDAPLPVISAGGVHAGVCEPFLVEYHGNRGSRNERVKSLEQPLPVQTAENRFGLCQPFVTKYYGTGTVQSVEEPLDTVTAHDRFGLVEPGRMDIYFRMLQPHELARAMGFDDGYVFCGTKSDKVRQIGNAVAVRTAAALCGEILRGMI
jgi:DNA (cytosine-5)-methyltransferase 1